MAEARKQRRQDPDAEPLFSMSDMGNAERLAAMHGRDIRYIHPWQKWVNWNGMRWMIDDEGEIVFMAKQAVRGIYEEAKDEMDRKRSAELARFAITSESDHRLRAMIHLCQSELGIPALPAQFDRDPWLLNVANGTLDLKTGKLRPHQRGDFITKVTSVAFDHEAESPVWTNFLGEIMDGNAPLIEFLQRGVGYSLTGDTTEQVIFILWGTGANGNQHFLKS